MLIIPQNNRVLALMGLYHPGKFESTPRSQSWDILFPSPVTDQKENEKNEKSKTKDLHLHADLITCLDTQHSEV